MNREFEARLDQLQIDEYNKVATDILSILTITSPEEEVNYDKYTFEFTPVSSMIESQLNSILANNLMKLYRVLEDTSVETITKDNMFCYSNGLVIDLEFKTQTIRLRKGRARCSVKMSKLSTYKELYDALVLTSSMK